MIGASIGTGLLLGLGVGSARLTAEILNGVGTFVRGVLYVSLITQLLVLVLLVGGRTSSKFGLIAMFLQWFIVGMILATAATAAARMGGASATGLQQMVLAPGMVRAVQLVTAATYFTYGAFKWITYAEFPFFQASGYSERFYIFVCAFECFCAFTLLFRVTALPTVLALIIEMFGAIYTHFHNYFAKGLPDPFGNSLDAFRMLILLAFIGMVMIRPKLGTTISWKWMFGES